MFAHLTFEFAHNLTMITSIATVLFAFAAQDVVPKLSFNVEPAKKDVIKGSLTVSIPAGWHGYQNPPKSEFENPIKLETTTKDFKITKISYPAGIAMKSSGMDSLVYEGDVKIPFEGKMGNSMKPGKNGMYEIGFTLSYQFCNASTCIPPSTLKAKIRVKVAK
jgi:DsbC/DsbD-like thiol-disulfide interchange protein